MKLSRLPLEIDLNCSLTPELITSSMWCHFSIITARPHARDISGEPPAPVRRGWLPWRAHRAPHRGEGAASQVLRTHRRQSALEGGGARSSPLYRPTEGEQKRRFVWVRSFEDIKFRLTFMSRRSVSKAFDCLSFCLGGTDLFKMQLNYFATCCLHF